MLDVKNKLRVFFSEIIENDLNDLSQIDQKNPPPWPAIHFLCW